MEVVRRKNGVAKVLVQEGGIVLDAARGLRERGQTEIARDPFEFQAWLAHKTVVVHDDEPLPAELAQKRDHMGEPQALCLGCVYFLPAKKRSGNAQRVPNCDEISVPSAAVAQCAQP